MLTWKLRTRQVNYEQNEETRHLENSLLPTLNSIPNIILVKQIRFINVVNVLSLKTCRLKPNKLIFM